MSEENVELVRALYDAVARGDSETVRAAYDPTVVVDFSRSGVSALENRVYRGHDGLRDANRQWYESWSTLRYDCIELIDAGDRVIATVTVRGRGHASGVETEIAMYGIWTIARGKIVRVDWVGSRREAVEAAGRSD